MKAEAISLLTEAVQSCRVGCALQRLLEHTHSIWTSLTKVGEESGFTRAESYGIMDGWDAAHGYRVLFSQSLHVASNDPQYIAGFELGQKLALEDAARLRHLDLTE
mgnify:CR=1 FL=1